MFKGSITPSGRERFFADDEIIVSKTDPTGKITYANNVFHRISSFEPHEILGQPHSIIRHPDMPRSIFKLLWSSLEARREIFAYVCNLASNGDHYWVLAHVTPTLDASGQTIGYHSNRRVPEVGPLSRIKTLYTELLAEEARHSDRQAGLQAGTALLQRKLLDKKVEYDEFVFAA